MTRVPAVDPGRDREIARLRRLLADLKVIPGHRREDEHADIRAETARAMLQELLEKK